MKWSKLKKAAEALLADALKRRIQYHVTQYGPGDSYTMARGWITFDGIHYRTLLAKEVVTHNR